MVQMKRPINIRFIVIHVSLYCLYECCMMNLNYHYFKSVLFYKPQGTLGSKYKVNKYHKILKISAGAYIFQRPFLRGLFLEGLSAEGNLRFKIDWASLIPGNKFTVFALFYFEFEGYFPSTSPWKAYTWRCDLT